MNTIETNLDWNDKYNIWSGLIGGFFLQLSYFGTDQSQVGRYLTGSSIAQSRLGLLMNGMVKIPMQFLIMLIGILVFTYYQFYAPPVYFNEVELEKLENSAYTQELDSLKQNHYALFDQKQAALEDYIQAKKEDNETLIEDSKHKLQAAHQAFSENHEGLDALAQKNNEKANKSDTDYVFLEFITNKLPVGVIGILVAIIFLASMGSAASGLNSLASTTVIDIYRRIAHADVKMEALEMKASRWSTIGWGIFCMAVAIFASRLTSLIEAVNILGSLFYGTILGIFVVAFYFKKIAANETFIAAIITEIIVILLWKFDVMAFLWLNVVGCLTLPAVASLLRTRNKRTKNKE
jgi:Na+/proline symporter